MISRIKNSHRSFVLIAVLVVIGSALFIATTLIYTMQSNAAFASNAYRLEQSRALAWSGIQAVTSELNRQREIILDGETPEIEEEYILYETDTELGVVRLLPLGIKGEVIVAEAGKLDLNTVDAETLARTGLIDKDIAQSIIDYRERTIRRPFQSVAELLFVDGITPEMLYGPLDELSIIDHANPATLEIDERILALYEGTEARGIADVVTVYAFEPVLQQNGKFKINLNVKWTSELERRVERRFDKNIAQGLKTIFERGYDFSSDNKLYELLVFFNTDPEEWPDIVDAFTTEADNFLKGRVDINTAPYEVLLSLPGIEEEQAAQIEDAREDLSYEELATVAWPAILGICEPKQYVDFADRITNRSWTWRVRIAAGTVDLEDDDETLQNPVIYEAVIDLSYPRARLAYLRDISLLQTTAMIASNADSDEMESNEEFYAELGGNEGDIQSDFDPYDDDEDGELFDDDPDRGRSSNFGFDDSEEDEEDVEESASSGGAGTSTSSRSSPGAGAPRRVGRWRRGD